VERRYFEYEEISRLEETPVQPTFTSYISTSEGGGDCYGKTTETKYGEPLGYVLAEDLRGLIKGPIGAFLDACNDHRKIALFWH